MRMIKMSEEQQRMDPVQAVLAFKDHIMSIHDALVGYKTELKHDDRGMPYLESAPDPDATPICTLEGGKYIVHNMQLFLNRHSSFADLNTDDVAKIPAEAVQQPIDMMIAYPEIYLVPQDPDAEQKTYQFSRLKTEGLALYSSLYMFFTALKAGGIKEFAESSIVVKWTKGDTQPESIPISLYGGNKK